MDFFEGTAAELQTLMALGTGAAPVVDLKVVGPTGQVIDCAPAWYDANRITAAFAPLLACTDIPHTDLPAQLFHQDTGRCFLGDARTWMEPRGWGLYYRQYADGRQLVYCQRVKAA